MLGQALSSTFQNNETNCELGMSKNLIPVTVNKKNLLWQFWIPGLQLAASLYSLPRS